MPTTTATSTTTEPEPAEPTPARREFERQMRAALRTQGQGGAVDVECAIDRLRESLPNETVEAAVEATERGEEIPQEAVDAAFEAGQACRR